MSAIFGLFQRKAGDVSDGLRAMRSVLGAYGPDGCVEWTNGAIGLGHQQMLVTAIESQHDVLPRYDDATRLAVTADVHLDNRAALGNALGITYLERAGLSDSEFILRAYRRWGRDCPDYLLGDFAFAIWNPQAQELFCARDHIGVKPFYYSLTRKHFVFASDINGVLAAPGVSDQFDEAYVAASLIDKFFTPNNRTFYQAVRKLPPGHTLTVQPDAVHLEQYWFPERAPTVRYASDADYAAAFLEIYTQAVHDRLRSTYPVGVHLSGGLDSSSIAVLAAREQRRQGRPPPPAFCWQPPPPAGIPQPDSEYTLIQAICAQEGLRAYYQSPGPEDILTTFRRDVTREPTVGTLLNEQVVQKQAAGQGIRVLLSGWGGDEGAAFNGRGYYPGLLLQGHWRQLYRESRVRTGHPLRFILMTAVLPLLHYKAPKLVGKIWQGEWSIPDPPFIHPDFSRRIKPLRAKPYRETGARETQLQLLDDGYVTARLEAWAASGAQHNIVYRYPLLDRRLLEFALGLPAEQFRRGRWNRWLMRNALQDILPPEICWNSSKNDPIRVQALLDVMPEALATIRQTLSSRTVLPARARYVDLPRLMDHLDPERFKANPKLGKIRASLHFLDFE